MALQELPEVMLTVGALLVAEVEEDMVVTEEMDPLLVILRLVLQVPLMDVIVAQAAEAEGMEQMVEPVTQITRQVDQEVAGVVTAEKGEMEDILVKDMEQVDVLRLKRMVAEVEEADMDCISLAIIQAKEYPESALSAIQ